jgi:uncharacterized protein
MSTPVLWLEIPVSNFERSVTFYQKVFQTTLEIRTLFETQMALFDKTIFGIKASIVENQNHIGSNGMKPIIYVSVMSETIDLILKYGGKLINEPTLLRQKNKDGDIIIGTNLIDGEVGYYAEVTDSEANHFYLYSHS